MKDLLLGWGISLGRNLALGLPKSHQPRLGSDIPVYPNTAFLQYGWIHLFADPRPAFCRLFSPTIPLHPYLFTRSMPPSRPPIDIITALSTFFPPLRRISHIHKRRPSIDRAYRDAKFLPSLALTCLYFLPLDLIVLFHMPIHTT